MGYIGFACDIVSIFFLYTESIKVIFIIKPVKMLEYHYTFLEH